AERMPRTETSLTAGRRLGLTRWHWGHASYEIVQCPVNAVAREHHVLENAFSVIGTEPIDVGNQTFSASVGIDRFRNRAGFHGAFRSSLGLVDGLGIRLGFDRHA